MTVKLLLVAVKAPSGNTIKVVYCRTIPSAFIAVTYFFLASSFMFSDLKHQENVFCIYCVESAGPAGMTVLLKQGFSMQRLVWEV